MSRTVKPTKEHRAFRDDVIELLRKHAGELPADEMLALASHLVGQLLALQDQRKITPALGLKLIGENIEAGNAEVVNGDIQNPLGRA